MKPTLRQIGLSLCALALASGPAAAKGPDLQTAQQPAAPTGKTALKTETLAEGLSNPWSLAFLPNGDILVTERAGRLRVVRNGALVAAPVAGTPAPYVANQAGYFDVLPHKDFASNRILYLAYAHGTKQANATRVVSAEFDGTSLKNVKTVFEARPLKDKPVHYGGRLAYLPDGTILVTLGDGFDYREKAQKLDNGFGKIVRVKPDGGFPKDNPFANKAGALPEIWSYGHRNVQGIAVDSAGVVYETEHGPRGGDEINRIEPGKNYGWPLACYCIDYSGARITPFTEMKGTVQPLKYWTPSIAPSGLAIVNGDLFPAWEGDLLSGAMAGRALHRIDMEGGKIVGEERYLVGERVREVRMGPDGAIYVTTEDRGGAPSGKVLRLTPAN